MPSFYIENFGCRASQADGAAIFRQLASRRLEPGSADTAEYVVLNTCTVTTDADRAARAAVRRIVGLNRTAKILVTGCYAQRAPEEVAALPGVTWVAGNSHKHAIPDILFPPKTPFVPLRSLLEPKPVEIHTAEIHVADIFAHTELIAAPVFGSTVLGSATAGDARTRPNLKVQDGCDNRCSFCIIPSVRGASRSRALAQVVDDVNALVAEGSHELVLSGINLGRWGRDLQPAARLETLVATILEQTSLEKLRLSSVEPMDWSDDLIALMRSATRIAKHAHVPMQSGSDAVLRRMHRKYRPWHYREKLLKIRLSLPTAAIGADVMTGFPGETDAEFEETLRMVEDLPLTYLHIFPYSARPGTPAAMLPNQVPVHAARERLQVLRELIATKKQAFAHTFVSKTVSAITLISTREEFTNSLTDNYLELLIEGCHEPNHWVDVRVTACSHGTLTGALA